MEKVTIYFKSEQEVSHFCEYLFQREKKITLRWRVHKKWGNEINIDLDGLAEEDLLVIADCFMYVFFTHRLGTWSRKIIEENYYFSDKHEIESIQYLLDWVVMSGAQKGVLPRKGDNPLELVESIFVKALQSGKDIYFDSIVQFGMKLFKTELIDYVGLAIDEFKREEEHQAFIHSVREYVERKEANIPLVHVLEANPFLYYNQQGELISQVKINDWLKREPLYLLGLSKDETILAPLIALIPETIYLYTSDPSSPKIQTILNVFQEKVLLQAVADFPFRHHYLRK